MKRGWGYSGRACELGELGLEERDDGRVLLKLGVVKGSVSIGCCDARIRSGSKEDLDCLHLALCTRYDEGSLAMITDLVDMSTCSEKDTDSFNLTIDTGSQEGSPAISTSQVYPNSCSEENAHHLHSAMAASSHQRRAFLELGLGARSVDVCPSVDQSIHHTLPALLALQTGIE